MQERRAYVLIEVVTNGPGTGGCVLVCTLDHLSRFGVLQDFEDEWPIAASDWAKQGREIGRWIRTESGLKG